MRVEVRKLGQSYRPWMEAHVRVETSTANEQIWFWPVAAYCRRHENDFIRVIFVWNGVITRK